MNAAKLVNKKKYLHSNNIRTRSEMLAQEVDNMTMIQKVPSLSPSGRSAYSSFVNSNLWFYPRQPIGDPHSLQGSDSWCIRGVYWLGPYTRNNLLLSLSCHKVTQMQPSQETLHLLETQHFQPETRPLSVFEKTFLQYNRQFIGLTPDHKNQ